MRVGFLRRSGARVFSLKVSSGCWRGFDSSIVLWEEAANNWLRMEKSTQSPDTKPRYTWPWFLAAAVIVGIVIAVFSIRAEANRIKLQQSLQMPTSDK